MSAPEFSTYFSASPELIRLAEDSIARRHFRFARKLIHQGLIDFPDADAAIRPLSQLLHETEEELRIKHHPLPGVPFDFLILPTLRAGSTYLDTVLNLHPELSVVPVAELDEALMMSSPGRLLQRYHHFLAGEKKRPFRAGLVFHRFLLAPDHIQYSAKACAQICDTTKFLQIVREPLGAFLSELNHEIIVNYLGDYRFSALGLPWPAQGPIPEGMPPVPNIEPLFDFLSKNRIFYSTVGKEFSKHFSKWEVLTLESLLPSNDYKGVAEVEKFCGVKKKMDPRFLRLPPNDWMKRLMEKNWFSISIENNNLPVGIGYAYETTITSGAAAIELCREPTEAAAAKGRPPFALSVRLHDWERLPDKLRGQLIRERPLAKVFESEFIPAWEINSAKWKSVAETFTQRELTGEQRKKLIERMKPEIAEFAVAKPQIAKHWPVVVEIS